MEQNKGQQASSNWAHPIRAVAFDMDGLLVNTETLYSEAGDAILQRRGHRFTAELKDKMMGLPAEQAYQVMLDHTGLNDSIETLQAETIEVFQKLLPERLELMPGVPALLGLLDKRKMPRCVATSSTHEFAAEVLERTSLGTRFDFVLTSEDVDNGKPAPDIYLLAAERLGVHSREMLVLEDSQHGSRAGIASGACTIGVPSEHSDSHDFSGCQFVANTLKDPRIKQLLDSTMS